MSVRRGLLVSAFVLALAATSCTKSAPAPSPSSSAPSPSTSPSPTVASSLSGVHASQPSNWSADPKHWSVTLSWEQPPTPFVVHHYVVERNGKLLNGDVIGTKYVDDEAEPGTKYRYSIVGVDAAGKRTDPGVVSIETHAPPLEDARMDGRYVVKFHITEQGNLTSGASGFPELFTFKPRCGSGACDVSLSIKKVSGSTVLARSGTSYSGTLHAPFLIRSCHGGTITETLVFHLHLLAAGSVHGEWRVTKFEGTMEETSSSSGCLTGHLAYALSGIVQG